MDVLLDVILVILAVLLIIRGWQRGVLSTLLVLIGWAVAAFIIAARSASWAASIYSSIVEPLVVSRIEGKISPETLAALQSGANALRSVQNVLDQLGGLLGGQIVDLGDLDAIESAMAQSGSDLAQSIADTVFAPMLTMLVRVGLSIVILLVSTFLFGRLAQRTSRRHRGVLGVANQLLGAVLGAGEGYAVGYIYAFLLSAGARLLRISWLTPEVLDRTVLIKYFLS